MLPALLVALGVALLGAGLFLMRGMGRAYRIGRTLAVAPLVPVATAIEMARAGRSRYVRVHGRITSDEEFADEHDRPLVFRRRRLEVATGGQWRRISDDREAVPFGVEERAAFIAVDAGQLDEGLVVLPRESSGRAADVPAHLPLDIDPDAPTRLVIDQISAVEQADVAGRPVVGPGGSVTMTAGAGRPLILSTLERSEAMRVLGAGHGRRLRLAAALFAAGALSLALAFTAALLAWSLAVVGPAAVAQAASPTLAGGGLASPVPSPGDTRSSGVGPGLVGQPFLAILIVVGVAGLGVGVATTASRLARRGRDGD